MTETVTGRKMFHLDVPPIPKDISAYIKPYSQEEIPILDSFRSYIASVKAPSEMPYLMTFMEKFAESYMKLNEKEVQQNLLQAVEQPENWQGLVTLIMAVIMLNVDQHNAQIKNRYTEERWSQYLSLSLPSEYMSKVYHSVRDNELKYCGKPSKN